MLITAAPALAAGPAEFPKAEPRKAEPTRVIAQGPQPRTGAPVALGGEKMDAVNADEYGQVAALTL